MTLDGIIISALFPFIFLAFISWLYCILRQRTAAGAVTNGRRAV